VLHECYSLRGSIECHVSVGGVVVLALKYDVLLHSQEGNIYKNNASWFEPSLLLLSDGNVCGLRKTVVGLLNLLML
jgi:hypothetical protein